MGRVARPVQPSKRRLARFIASLLADPRLTRRLFDWGAWSYGLYTDQAAWKASCAELVRHFPPTAEPPRVLDLGCGPGVSSLEFARRLPEAKVIGLDIATGMLRQAQHYAARDGLADRIPWIQADATRLPFASNSLDVATGHSFLYLVGDRRSVLAETYRVLRPGGRIVLMEPNERRFDRRVLRRIIGEFRFVVSVVLWRFYSRVHGPFTPASLAETLRQARFVHILAEETLGGLGLIGRGEKGALDVQHEASRVGAGRSALVPAPGQPQGLPLQRSTPYLYLLITQRPNRPGWQPASEGEIAWDAQVVAERETGQDVLLAFSSLVNAVAFMRPAVMAGLMRDVNKVGKFRRETVESWGMRFLVNPRLEELHAPDSAYVLAGRTVRVDHRQRERHEEEGDQDGGWTLPPLRRAN